MATSSDPLQAFYDELLAYGQSRPPTALDSDHLATPERLPDRLREERDVSLASQTFANASSYIWVGVRIDPVALENGSHFEVQLTLGS